MIKATKIIPGGQALSTMPDGKKAFFWGALPGEYIKTYKTTKNKSHYLEAIALEIDSPSSNRTQPKDDCYLSTSPWQIIDYKYELELKQSLVIELFCEHQIAIPKPPIFTDNHEYYYRNKMEYALYWNNEKTKIELAFHQRGSHRKIPITKSSIERPEIFKKAEAIIADLNHRGEEARKYQSLLLRCDQKGEVSGGLYENHQPHPTFPNLTDVILGRDYSYSPNGFFQINLPVYEMVLKEIKHHIATDEVLDLYAGVGTIGLSVANNHQLKLVEVDKYAFSEMVKNIVNSGAPASDLIKYDTQTKQKSVQSGDGRILAILDKSENVTSHLKETQTVILDPPRSGCDKKLIEGILKVNPARIIYLSCNPATQARDVKLLLENYYIDAIKTYNFFPHTPHIENLVVLSRK